MNKVYKLIRERGGVLQRKKNHEVWKFPGGQTFVRGKTPSDSRAEANNFANLRRLLGIGAGKKKKPTLVLIKKKQQTTTRPNAPVTTTTTIQQPTIQQPLGTFVGAFERRLHVVSTREEREALQTAIDNAMWTMATKGIKKT